MFNESEAEKELIELEGKDPALEKTGAGPIDLGASTQPLLKDRAAEHRATQYAIAATGTAQPVPYSEILSSIQQGTYNSLQEKLASEKQLEQRKIRYGQVQELLESGQKLTTEQQDFVMSLSEEKFKNPMSIVEEEFAKVLNQFLTTRTTEDIDENVHKKLDFAENMTAKVMVAQNQHQNALARYETMGLGDYARGFKSWVPFYSWYNLSQGDPSAQSSQEGIGQGAEMKAMVDQIWSEPDPGKMAEMYHDTFERLWEGSPSDAMAFSEAMQSYTKDNRYIDNFWSAIDVATSIPIFTGAKIIKGLKKGGKETIKPLEKAVQVIREGEVPSGTVQAGKGSSASPSVNSEALKGASKVLGRDGADPVKVLDGAGMSKEAGKIEALTTVKKLDEVREVAKQYGDDLPVDVAKDIERVNLEMLARQTMTLMNPGKWGSDIGSKSGEYAKRLIAQMEMGQDTLKAVLGQSIKVTRGTEAAYQIGFEEAEMKMKQMFNRNMDAIQDIRRVSPEDSLSGVGYVEFLVGRPDGGGFRTPLQARAYGVRTLGLKDQFLVEQSGAENYIRVRKNVDETTNAFRVALNAPEAVSVKGKLPAILQWLRSPEDKFSDFMRGNRSAAVSGSQRVQALMRDTAKPIEDLTGAEKTRLDRMMELNRDYIDDLDPTKRGKFYSSIRDYETAYKQEFGNIPSEAETDAYFAALKINDIDYVFRNLGIYRDKARMGYETITLSVGPNKVKSFEGKVVDSLPLDDGHNAGIFVFAGPDDYVHAMKNNIKGEVKELLNKRINEEGWKVVQILNPVEKIFEGMTDKSVNFLVTKSVKQAPLSFNQIPYKPGFHVAYKDEHFVKQGKFEVLEDGSKRRLGDVAAMSASSGAKAQKIAEAMEEARILMNKGDDEALRLHLEKTLPEEWDIDTFKSKFEDTINPQTGEVLKKARFQKEVPFVSVRTGQSVTDAGVILKDGKGFHELFPDVEDPLSSPYNEFSKVNKQYAGQRDPTLDALDEGSEANPVYRLDKSELVRPIDVLQNSMATIIRNRYFEDLQIISAESYVEEFGDILLDSSGKAFSRNELRRNPLLALHEAQFDRKVNPQRISQAKQIRQHTLDLLGTPSWTAKHIQAYTDSLKNFAYESMGEKGVKLVPDHLIHTISDPFQYARSVAFHTKLGLFNIVQLFVQGQALAVTSSIAPRYATRSMGATGIMRMLDTTKNAANIDYLAGISEKLGVFGMKKAEFKDSYFWLKETGFDLVGQDHAWRGDIFQEKLFMSQGKRFLDKGAMFFNAAERFTRMNAWNTAYMEYIEKNALKAGRLTAKDAKKILVRTKDLNVNMSRESNAIYQQGPLSAFTQFWGYQARLTDLMLGKRLGRQEKIQLLAGMSALYGVSGPANTISPFYNVYQDIREEALKRGIDPNAGLMGYVMNGMPAMFYGMAFGDQPNFGERFGPSGFPIVTNIEKAMEDSELPVFFSLLKQAGGAGASITTDIIIDTIPFIGELLSIKDGQTTANITAESAGNVLKNISSVNNMTKMYHALKTGEWISSNGAVLTDGISTPQALFYGLTGTQPQEIPDAFFMNNVANEYKSAGARDEYNGMLKEARTMIKKYLTARDQGDNDSAAVWSQRLTVLFNGTGLTATQKQKMFTQSMQGDTMVEAILRKFIRNGTPEERDARMRTFGEKGTEGN